MNATPADEVLQQVQRAIALNRTPGYHFCGNFIDLEMYHDDIGQSRVAMRKHAAITDEQGLISPIALAIMADFAFASAVRSACDPAVRLATVALNLSFTGRAAHSDLSSTGSLLHFHENAQGRLGLSQAEIHSHDGLLAFGTSSFMVLPTPPGQTLHPIAWVNQPVLDIEAVPPTLLTDQERWILDKASAALSSCSTGHFLQTFVDLQLEKTPQAAKALFTNGPHMSNRVGHVQGGISLGVAMIVANEALGVGWAMSGIHANFVRPGQGQSFRVQATHQHRGSLTAVLNVTVQDEAGNLCLVAQTTHARLKG